MAADHLVCLRGMLEVRLTEVSAMLQDAWADGEAPGQAQAWEAADAQPPEGVPEAAAAGAYGAGLPAELRSGPRHYPGPRACWGAAAGAQPDLAALHLLIDPCSLHLLNDPYSLEACVLMCIPFYLRKQLEVPSSDVHVSSKA